MHELALAEDIVETVTRRLGTRRVARVRVRVGQLVAVEPAAMRFCFDVATHDTPLEGATLEVEPVPARGRCRDCGRVMSLPDGLPLCACGSVNVAITAGRELVIQDVEVAAA